MSAIEFQARPFADLPNEADWVMLRELVAAGTIKAKTTKEYGSHDVLFVTQLPGVEPALKRSGGEILVSLHTQNSSGDASRDLAQVLLTAADLAPGKVLRNVGRPEAGPRLQDVLDLAAGVEVKVHDDFEFWVDPSVERTEELIEQLETAKEMAVDGEAIAGVDSAYWFNVQPDYYLRWAFAEEEDTVIDAYARMRGQRDGEFGGSKFAGYFRASGIVILVWDLPDGTTAEQITEPFSAWAQKFTAALGETTELDGAARRARAGIVARQVTLR